MKGLKIARIFTVCVTACLLVTVVPFVTNTADTTSIVIKIFDFNFFANQNKVLHLFADSKIDAAVYLTGVYGSLACGIAIFCAFWLTLIKKQTISLTFNILTIIFDLGAVVCIIIKALTFSVFFFENEKIIWVFLAPVMILAIVDVILATTDVVAKSLLTKMATIQASAPAVQYVAQPLGADGVPIQNPQASQPLTDSVQIKQRITNLKSGLNMPSYDEALEVIESTGEWQGLNMKDVQEYNYEDEIAQNQMKLNKRLSGEAANPAAKD
jgi:hypothetical protein